MSSLYTYGKLTQDVERVVPRWAEGAQNKYRRQTLVHQQTWLLNKPQRTAKNVDHTASLVQLFNFELEGWHMVLKYFVLESSNLLSEHRLITGTTKPPPLLCCVASSTWIWANVQGHAGEHCKCRAQSLQKFWACDVHQMPDVRALVKANHTFSRVCRWRRQRRSSWVCADFRTRCRRTLHQPGMVLLNHLEKTEWVQN